MVAFHINIKSYIAAPRATVRRIPEALACRILRSICGLLRPKVRRPPKRPRRQSQSWRPVGGSSKCDPEDRPSRQEALNEIYTTGCHNHDHDFSRFLTPIQKL